MAKPRRNRYLRKQKERLRRKAASAIPSWTAPGQAAEVVCDICDLRFSVEMPVMGFKLDVEWSDKEGRHEASVPVGVTQMMVPCPACGGGGPVVNTQSHLDAAGVRWTYFASTEAEKQELREVLEFLSDEQASPDAVAAALEQRGPLLAALAQWVRASLRDVPSVVVQVVLTVIFTQLIGGASLSSDELDRILQEHQRQYLQQQTKPGHDARQEPHSRKRPPPQQKPEERISGGTGPRQNDIQRSNDQRDDDNEQP